jgi:hypothetical protein
MEAAGTSCCLVTTSAVPSARLAGRTCQSEPEHAHQRLRRGGMNRARLAWFYSRLTGADSPRSGSCCARRSPHGLHIYLSWAEEPSDSMGRAAGNFNPG